MKDSSTSLFTSARERRLWLWAIAVVVGIYSTLGLAQTLAKVLRDRDMIGAGSFIFSLFLVGAAVLALGLKARPRGVEIGVALGIVAVYLLVFLRMAIPEERGHIIEYSVLAVFIYEALTERVRNGRRVPAAAVIAWVMTALLGWLDEGIQALLPNRVYDIRDVGFNSFAAFLAIAASLALTWTRKWGVKFLQNED